MQSTLKQPNTATEQRLYLLRHFYSDKEINEANTQEKSVGVVTLRPTDHRGPEPSLSVLKLKFTSLEPLEETGHYQFTGYLQSQAPEADHPIHGQICAADSPSIIAGEDANQVFVTWC